MNIMTLDDFFTLSEMKDGLMAHVRVEELVSIMQKEKFSVVKNVSEAARQWSTVASILAATENKDNLDCFIQLGGLCFLDHWLQKAQECSNAATRDSTVEESVSALLGALKKLPVDNERSVTHGIRITVKNLLGHQSSRVQERAKALLDSWNQGGGYTDAADQQDVEKEGCESFDDDAIKTTDATTDMQSGSPEHFPVKGGSINVDNHGVNLVGGDLQYSRSSEGSQLESVKDVETTVSDNMDASRTSLIWKDEDKDQGDPQTSSLMPPLCREILSTIAESSIHPEGVASSSATCSPVPEENNVEDRSSDVPQLKDLTQDVKETDNTISSIPEKNCEKKISSISSVPDPLSSSSSSSTNSENILQSMTQAAPPIDIDAKNCEIYLKETLLAHLGSDSSKLASERRSEVGDCAKPKHLSNKAEQKATVQTVGCYSSVLQAVSIDCCILRRPEDPDTFFSNEEDTGAVNHVKVVAGESCLKGRGENYATTSKVSKSFVNNTKVSAMGGKTRQDMELDFMVDDALEVARKVAKEVEREVVDYREPFCSSSSEKRSVDGLVQPRSPDSMNGEQHQPVMGPSNETPKGQNLLENPNIEEDHLVSSKNMVKPQDSILDPDSSQVTATAEEPEGGSTKESICEFDLNEDVFSEQMDHQRSPNAAPVTCGSPSKAAASELPAAPLHFEVYQGLKGSATTCALFPASSCRTLDAEKELPVDGLKQRQDFRGIDLNVTEGDDFRTIDLVSEKQMPVSSGLPSGKSSTQVSSRRAHKIDWDLNLVGENEDAPSSDCRTEKQPPSHHREDGHRSPSPSSSSSSRQPSMRNIDLNDNPFLCNYYDPQYDLSKSSSLEMNDHGRVQVEDPIISIMGARVEINRKEFQPRSWSFLSNGQVPGYPVCANTMAYASHSLSVSGCDGLMMGSTVSNTAVMYGATAVPYIVDASGVPVAPQLMSSPVAVASSYSRPFLVSMTSAPSASNDLESQRPILDLNSGMTVAEGENRESGGLRQLLFPRQDVSPEEQPLSLGLGLKRREPDTGCDKHPMNFKQQSPWR